MSETLYMTIDTRIKEHESVADKPRTLHLLAHLCPAQVEELYGRYLAGESCAALVAEFGVQCPANGLIKAFPPFTREDLPCPYCSTPMLETRKTKTGGGGVVSCPLCKHNHRRSGGVYQSCSCRGCNQVAKREQEERRQRQAQAAQEWVERCNQLGPLKVPLSTLLPADRFLCFTLALTSTLRRGKLILQLERWASSTELANTYLQQLMQVGALKVSYQGLYLHAVETARSTRDIRHLPFELTVCSDAGEQLTSAEVIAEFLETLNVDVTEWAPDIFDIIQAERAHDVLEYMDLMLGTEKVPFRDEQPKAQALSVITRHLKYPMSLLYAAAWRSAMSVGRGLRNRHLTCLKHANNATHGTLERTLGGEDFMAGTAKHFNREPRLSQSAILGAVEQYLIQKRDVIFRASEEELRSMLLMGLRGPMLPY